MIMASGSVMLETSYSCYNTNSRVHTDPRKSWNL